jgi:membrane protein implicated in regulation of membrane protease activity
MGIGIGAIILEQIGVILLSIFLLYLVFQWIERSKSDQKEMERALQKAKVMRQEAMERSRELLSGGKWR